MAEVGARRYRVPALANMVVRGHDHRHLRGEPDALAAGRVERVVARLGVVRGKRGHGGPQHVHGVRVLHRADHVVDCAGQRAGLLQRPVEGLELGPRREFAVQQQVGGLFERRVRGEIVNGVAAVAELAGPPIDERGRRAVEAKVLQAAMHLGLVRIRHELLAFRQLGNRIVADEAGHAIAAVLSRASHGARARPRRGCRAPRPLPLRAPCASIRRCPCRPSRSRLRGPSSFLAVPRCPR